MADNGVYSIPNNAKLHVNGTLELLPTNRCQNVYVEAAKTFHDALLYQPSLTPERLDGMTFFIDIGAKLNFNVNGLR